jgi:hypothetical protein
VVELDRSIDEEGLDEEGLALTCHLEDQLFTMDKVEEKYWRQ